MSTMAIGGAKPAAKKTVRESIKFHLLLGLGIVLVLVVGLGGWSSTVLISGALIAPGQIVVESNVKKVQHPTGGVVGEVRARDGDLVKAGDIVVRLDDTVTKANLAIVTKNLDAAQARAARLQAEQRGVDRIEFPQALLDRASDPDVKLLLSAETKLFDVRVNGRTGQKAQLRERITQLNEEISGLSAQEKAKDQEISLVQNEAHRRAGALRQAPGPDLAPDPARTRLGPPQRRARAVHRLARPGQGQDHRDRAADHPGRQGRGERGLQGPARDQRQDRRADRAQGCRRRPASPHRHPRAAGRHGAAIECAHGWRRRHRRRRAHADRAAGGRSPGRGQGQPGRHRQAPDRPEDAASPLRVQPAHHARGSTASSAASRPTSPPTSAPARATTPSASRCRPKRSPVSAMSR